MFSQIKLIKLRFSENVGDEKLASFRTVKENDGVSAVLEVHKEKQRESSKAILDSLPVFDLNIGTFTIMTAMYTGLFMNNFGVHRPHYLRLGFNVLSLFASANSGVLDRKNTRHS